jgi:hypothetical protein
MTQVDTGVDETRLAWTYVPPELSRRQERMANALGKFGAECEELGFPLETTVEIALSIVANVVCPLVPSEHDDVLLEVFADLLGNVRGNGCVAFPCGAEKAGMEANIGARPSLDMTGRASILNPAPIPRVLRKKSKAFCREACELMNECMRRGYVQAIGLLFNVVAVVLCNRFGPQNDQAFVAIFASAMKLARSGINLGNLGAAGYA